MTTNLNSGWLPGLPRDKYSPSNRAGMAAVTHINLFINIKEWNALSRPEHCYKRKLRPDQGEVVAICTDPVKPVQNTKPLCSGSHVIAREW